MIRKVRCRNCAQVFSFDTTDAPAQRARLKGCRRPGPVVAYYPTCPHCAGKAEVGALLDPGQDTELREHGG